MSEVIAELAHQMAIVPLLWLVGLAVRKRRPDVAFWWLAGAFAVSWLADWGAHWVDPWIIGLVYPVTQAALVAAVFLDRLDAAQFLVALVIVAIVDVLWHGVAGPDVLLRTVAWGSVAAIAWDRRGLGRLRTALVVSFGVALICWWGYATWPGWASWLTYQGVRAAGIALFCLAATQPLPRLTIARRGQ